MLPKLDKSNPKYIRRTALGMKKHGTKADGTEAGHRFSFRLLNNLETRSPGAALGDDRKRELIRAMNQDGNLRIKANSGNRPIKAHMQKDNDDTNDKNILTCVYVTKTPISPDRAVRRAIQAYKGAQAISGEFPKYARTIGEWMCEVRGRQVPVKEAEEARKRENVPGDIEGDAELEDVSPSFGQESREAPVVYDSRVSAPPPSPAEDVRYDQVSAPPAEQYRSPSPPRANLGGWVEPYHHGSPGNPPSALKIIFIVLGIVALPFFSPLGCVIIIATCIFCE